MEGPPVHETCDHGGQKAAQHGGQDDEDADEKDGEGIKVPGQMPRHAVGREERGDQEEKRPGGNDGGLDHLPAEDGLRRHGQGQERGRLPVSEKIGVADDEVAQHQEGEEKREEEEEQPFDQQAAETGKLGHKREAAQKQPEGERQVAGHEETDDESQQRGLLADAPEPPPGLEQVRAHEQSER